VASRHHQAGLRPRPQHAAAPAVPRVLGPGWI
jgi:hypothetical protein